MAQETELKLALHAHELPRLLNHPLLTGQKPRCEQLFNTYFDTPDLALMRERIAVRERRTGRRCLLTVKTAGHSVGGLSQRGEWEGPTRPGALGFAALVDEPGLARTLVALAPQLRPVFSTDFERLSWQLNFQGAQIEVALDRGEIRAGEAREVLLELELELQSGPVDALLALAIVLALGPEGEAASGLWLCPSERSKAERGLALCLGKSPSAVADGPVPLHADMDPVQAFCATALACLGRLQSHVLALAHESPERPDPERVHQARVALRQLRTGLKLFAPFLPRRFARRWDLAWKATASGLGEARNWDVFAQDTLPLLLKDGDGGHARPPAQDWVAPLRRAAQARARSVLLGPALALHLLAFTRGLLALRARALKGQRRSLSAWARALLRRRQRRLLERARQAVQPQALHALRIAVKRQRYTQDFLSSLLPPHTRCAAVLKQAQDSLGRLNDLATAQSLLAQAPQGAQLEWLLERLEQEELACLAQVPALRQALRRCRRPWD